MDLYEIVKHVEKLKIIVIVDIVVMIFHWVMIILSTHVRIDAYSYVRVQ